MLPPQPGEVHLWHFLLRRISPESISVLDAHEQKQARRFVFPRDRERYLAAHFHLRRVLGAYLGIAASAVQFARSSSGKPMLVGPSRGPQPRLTFNLSHAGDRAVLAVAGDIEVGVDIETLRREEPDAALARTVLTDQEFEQLNRLPPHRRSRAFLECWTRKEACLKALGLGLGREPRRLPVGVDTADRRLVRPLWSPRADVTVTPVRSPNGYVASLAAVGELGRVSVQPETFLEALPA